MTRLPSPGEALRRLSLLLPLLLAFISISSVVDAKKVNRNAPHVHNGKLAPWSPGPFDVLELTKQDEDDLSKDKSVMKQIAAEEGGASGGRAICVQDVRAPKSAVWNQILDLDHYVGKVNKLKECKNYAVKKKEDGSGWQIKTKMLIGVMPGYSYEYYCDHTYCPSLDSVVWNLDYDKTSDFDDVSGHWHVEDHPRNPSQSRVFYACDIKFKRPVPGPIMNFLTKSALKQATGWVKRESEAKPEGVVPAIFGGAPATAGVE